MIVKIEYQFDFMPTYALEQILREDLRCMNSPFLPEEAIFYICNILAKRRKQQNRGSSDDVKRKLLEIKEFNLECEDLSE